MRLKRPNALRLRQVDGHHRKAWNLHLYSALQTQFIHRDLVKRWDSATTQHNGNMPH